MPQREYNRSGRLMSLGRSMTDKGGSTVSRLLPLRMSVAIPFCLIVPLLGLAGEPPVTKLPGDRGPEGQRVREYTKVWTDDYGNYHKDVYHAYTKTLKDEQGEEVTVEIWHGKATGFHKNGKESWQGDYRDGKREGEFTMWADNGTRTNLATWQHGLIHGKYYQWDRDGRKMREETYEKGKLNGETRWWDRDGNLLTTGTYRDGKPWTGTFPELVTAPGDFRYEVICQYEGGKKVSEKKLRAKWWW
jgi:hypothetical protein